MYLQSPQIYQDREEDEMVALGSHAKVSLLQTGLEHQHGPSKAKAGLRVSCQADFEPVLLQAQSRYVIRYTHAYNIL